MPDHGRNRCSRLSRRSRRGVQGPTFIGLMAFSASLAPAMADNVAVTPSVVVVPSTQMASVNSSLMPPSAPLVQPSQQGVDVLIRQAKFWRDRSRTDLAEQMLNRVLAVNPQEPQALYAMGQMAAEDGRQAEARQWLVRLAAASPADPRVASLQKAISGGEVSPQVVDQARRLVSAGQYDAAVARYRQAFGGSTPPAQYALEYYQTLAGTDTDWDGAHLGLAGLAQKRPGDPRVQFAYAQVLTFREGTRRDGISILSKLAPTMNEAKMAWRQALIWLNATEADKPLFTAYLSQYPDDRDLEAKQLASQTIEPADQVAVLVGQGFVSLNNARLDDAAASFQRALALNPKSAPALGGFGVVNLRAGRFTDAASYLQKAIEADPAEKGRWETALAAASFYGTMDVAVTARDKGDLAKAEQLARQLANGDDPDRGDAQLLLADVLRKQAKYAQAEDIYARLVQANPGEKKLAAALADVRAKQGKPVMAADASASPSSVEAAVNVPSPDTVMNEAKQARDDGRPTDALALINRLPLTQKTADVVALTGTLNAEHAIAQARIAYAAGQKSQAVAMLGELAATPGANTETRSNIARAYYDMGQKDQAEQLVRNEMGRVASVHPADYRGFISVAALSGDDAASDQLLRNIAVNASSSPDDQAEIGKLRAAVTGAKADRLRLAGNFTGAWDMLADGFKIAPGAPELLGPLARLYQTGHLPLQALQIYEVMLQKDPGNVALMTEAISASIDAGALPRAQAMLQQAMRKDPRNPRLYLLASRVAQASGDRSDALNVLDTARALQREQAGVADAGGSYRTASLGPVSIGSSGVPVEPSTVAQNSTSQNPGHEGEIKVADSLSGPPVYVPASPTIPGVYTNQPAPVKGTVSTPSTVVVNPAAVPVYAPGATMQRVTLPGFQPAQSSVPTYGAPGYAATDSLSQQIDQEIASVEQQVAPRIDASVAYSGHNGSSGLSKMQDVTGTAAFTFSPFNTGRLTVAVMPEHIESGTPKGTRLAEFGYNPSLYGNSVAAGKQSDSGVGLGAAYSIGRVTTDIGTTPIGFAHTNMVGGVEWTPKLADNVTLRAKLERRAVMETVLSYAGTRDNYSGRKWGAVTKTGGSLGLSYDDGKNGAYVDGSYYEYRGLHVANNSAIGANVGAYIRPILAQDRMLQVGVNVNYANFRKNLGQFSFGHGGYFSPQQYVAFALPVEYDGKADRWSYRLQGAPGYQITRQSAAPYFPTDNVAQTNLNYAAAGSGGSIQSYYASSNDKGFGFSGLGQVEYELTKTTTVGATAGYNSFGNYHETKAMIYLKQMLGE